MLKWANGLVIGLLSGLTAGIIFMEYMKKEITNMIAETSYSYRRPRNYSDYYKKHDTEKEDK